MSVLSEKFEALLDAIYEQTGEPADITMQIPRRVFMRLVGDAAITRTRKDLVVLEDVPEFGLYNASGSILFTSTGKPSSERYLE